MKLPEHISKNVPEYMKQARIDSKRRRKPTEPKGHIMPPGTGPDGETCGTCQHLYRKQMSKTYLKCGLNSSNWTGGHGSDIRARDAACSKWEGCTDD